jgi:tetratricopeptide (TPR) repeat protein
MTDPVFKDPRRVLAKWGILLLAAAGLTVCGNLGLWREVGLLRAASPWTHLKVAERLQEDNRWLDAIHELEIAARHDPASPVAWERIGLIYAGQLQQWDKALQAFQEAIKRGSRTLDVRGKSMWCMIHLKRFDAAAEFGKACIQEGFDSPYFPRFIGEAYRRGGKYAEAIPYIEKALGGFPNDLYLMEQLADAYTRLGDNQKVLEIKKRIDSLAEH